jgi:hypothetical protein
MDKEALRPIVKAFKDQGIDVEVTGPGHLVVTRDGALIATFSGTASDWRSIRNGRPAQAGRVPVAS